MRPFPLALAALLALLPLPLAAASGQATMTAEEFDAYVTGKTLTYSQFGQVFGTEEYLPGRKVRWQFTADECQYGSWYPRDDLICFHYEYDQSEHCWRFWKEGDGLTALSVDDPPGWELSEVAETTQGLSCPGPDVGV